MGLPETSMTEVEQILLADNKGNLKLQNFVDTYTAYSFPILTGMSCPNGQGIGL